MPWWRVVVDYDRVTEYARGDNGQADGPFKHPIQATRVVSATMLRENGEREKRRRFYIIEAEHYPLRYWCKAIEIDWRNE